MTATYVGRAWSCTVRLVIDDDRALVPATEDLVALLAKVDAAASRFRADSSLSVANARAGRPTAIPRVLVDLVGAALEAAARTDGAVDPTVGAAMVALGYDRDIDDVRASESPGGVAPRRRNAWRAVRLHRGAGLLTVPVGTALDLGATAKARTADLAATELAARYRTPVLVELGGDLAVAGDRPDGWCVRVAEREGGNGQLLQIHRGGLTTSTTTVRTWRSGGRTRHHILDPRTGHPADGPWRTASVAARSAFEANLASTAAIVLGDHAEAWLTRHGFAARLVGADGTVRTTAGWPAPHEAVAA